MIDCHAHAFPDLAAKLPEPLRAGASALAGLARSGPWSKLLGGLPLDFEKLSSFRKAAPGPVQAAAEMTACFGVLPTVLLAGTLEGLGVSMREHGLERTVVIGSAPVASNDWLIEAVRGDSRFVPVAHVPQLPADASPARWEDAYDQLARRGFAGFKIHPNYDGHPPDHAAWRALFETARAHDKFVILHTGHFCVPGYKNMRPADAHEFAALFADYPTVRVCLAHLNRDHPEQVFDLLGRFEQLWADTSWQPADAVRAAIAAVGPGKLLLGSDWPLMHLGLQGDAVSALRRGASEDELRRIGDANARAFIGKA